MKLITWNVAGLSRVVDEASRKHGSWASFLTSLDADIICIQEAKLLEANVTPKEACPEGFESFWAYCTSRKGQSGCTTFVKKCYSPISASTAPFQCKELDDEGRCVITDHGSFVVLNVYVPNAGDAPKRDRLEYKMKFLRSLRDLARSFSGMKTVLLAGDINIAHTECDVYGALAKVDPAFHGYSEEEIAWMDSVFAGSKVASSASAHANVHADGGHSLRLIDSWRATWPAGDPSHHRYSVWDWRTEARSRNEGCRIDYIGVDSGIWDTAFLRPRERLMQSLEMEALGAAGSSKSTSSIAPSAACLAALTNPVLDSFELAGKVASDQNGLSCMISTPNKWSDHIAVMVTLDLPMPAPHPPCTGSSAVNKRFKPAGANLKAMFASQLRTGGSSVVSSGSAQTHEPASLSPAAIPLKEDKPKPQTHGPQTAMHAFLFGTALPAAMPDGSSSMAPMPHVGDKRGPPTDEGAGAGQALDALQSPAKRPSGKVRRSTVFG